MVKKLAVLGNRDVELWSGIGLVIRSLPSISVAAMDDLQVRTSS